MKVTGWTYWGNSKYIDITKESMNLRVQATKDIPKIPNMIESQQYSEEELSALLEQHDIAFEKALDTKEIHDFEKLIEEANKIVIEDIRKNGYHFTGEVHQNAEFGAPILDDKYILCVSMRTWGGFIAKAFPEEIDNSEGFGYCKWAWYNEELKPFEKIPDKSLIK